MSVRFKFKNDLDYQPIPCDGFHISVRDLKQSIIRSKKFGKVTDFDLVVTNSQTNKVYLDDNELISKNTTLTVQRAPLGEGKKKVWEEESSLSASIALASHTTTFSSIPGLNLSQHSADSEDDKISKMMSNSSEMYSEKHWTKYKGQRALPDGAKPPPHWKCSKCLANHWVSDCPFANNDMKRTTGIPRSFLKPAESNVQGAKINPQGLIVVNEMEKRAYSEKKVEKNPWLTDDKPAVSKVFVPTELLCPICKDLLKDAVMMPCCAGSACDECARNGIIDSEGSRCPVCADVANPEELIPYRLFRDKVDKFRNQTGYTKATHNLPVQLHLSAKPTLPDIVLPDLADLVGYKVTPGVKVEPPNLNLSLNITTNGSPGHTDQATPVSPNSDSPHDPSASKQQLSPHTPTSTPPRSPGTPTSSPRRSRSHSRRSRSLGTPISPHNGSRGRDTPTPTTSPQHSHAPLVDTSVPPPMYTEAPGPTLPPGHVLEPSSHYPPPPPQLAPAPLYYHQPTMINPAEDPLAAFEAAMRKLDSKKASRGRLGPSSPPRAYRVDRARSRSRERFRDYRERDYSPHRRSPGGFRGHSPRRGMSPRRGYRGRSRGSGPRSPSPFSAGDSRHSFVSEGRTASPGTGRDYRGDSHGKLGSRQRKERYVTDIPPETAEERRDRERFEREHSERERYQKEQDRNDQYNNYKRIERSKGRVAPTPPKEFLESERGNEYREKESDNRTPSLSPEPGTDQHEYYMRRKEQKQREERDKDVRNKEEGVKYRDERACNPRDEERDYTKSSEDKYKDHLKPRERSIDRSREIERNRSREVWDKEKARAQNTRAHEYREGVESEKSKYHDHEDWDRNRERGRERERLRDVRERSRERKDGSRDRRDRSKEDYRQEHSVCYKDERNGHKGVSEERTDDYINDETKESKKEKKSKKSKKKNKKKDKDSDEDEEGKENKKKKKKGKKKKDRDPESNDEQNPADEIKPLVPYEATEDVKTNEESSENQENQEEKPPVDPTKFINSFSEAKAEENKPKLNLPTLVFNEKIIELAPKDVYSTDNHISNDSKTHIKTDVSPPGKSNADTVINKYVLESKHKIKSSDLPKDRTEKMLSEAECETKVSSKWDREEYPEMDFPLVKNPGDPEYARELEVDAAITIDEATSGPQNVLRMALANMEKDNLVRDKKRKSLEVTEPEKEDDLHSKKKKKKKKEETEDESSEEEAKEKTKKKNKRKKKGGLEIPEKTLMKLLKKNLIKKKALEKLISGEGKKKKKKTRDLGDTSDLEKKESKERIMTNDTDEEGMGPIQPRNKDRKSRSSLEERIVRRRDSNSGERRIVKRRASEEREKTLGKKGIKRDTSEEEREVKSSKEGTIQVRLDNNSSKLSSIVGPDRNSLTSIVQSNLLKMAGPEMDRGRCRRDSPPRKSIKDRLGPLSGGDISPVKRDSSRGMDRNISRLGEDRLVRRTAALMAVKDRLGGNKERGGMDRDEHDGSGHKTVSARERLGAVPADLQAWALKATGLPAKHGESRDRKKSESLSLSSGDDRRKVKRRRSISREKRNNSNERKRNTSREMRRSNSREKRRSTPSSETKSKTERKKEKRQKSPDTMPEISPVKKRRNHRLTNEVDRSFNSDSD